MPKDREVRVAPAAKNSLKNIEERTADKWGEQKREQYMSRLSKRIKMLATNPRIGVSRKDLKGERRVLVVGEHLIVYRVGDQHVEVSHVLHQSMDIRRELTRERGRDRADDFER